MKLIWYLLCYSLLGFVGEVLYARLTHSAKPDRKCRLFLPLCPVYGIGAVVIALLPFRSPISVFLTAAAVATGVEYLCSVFYEKAWGVTFWNYHDLPGNVNRRVCSACSSCRWCIPSSNAWCPPCRISCCCLWDCS